MSPKDTLTPGNVITFAGERYMVTNLTYAKRGFNPFVAQPINPIMDCRLEAIEVDGLDPVLYNVVARKSPRKPRSKPRTKSKKK